MLAVEIVHAFIVASMLHDAQRLTGSVRSMPVGPNCQRTDAVSIQPSAFSNELQAAAKRDWRSQASDAAGPATPILGPSLRQIDSRASSLFSGVASCIFPRLPASWGRGPGARKGGRTSMSGGGLVCARRCAWRIGIEGSIDRLTWLRAPFWLLRSASPPRNAPPPEHPAEARWQIERRCE